MMIWRGLSPRTIVAAAEAVAQRKSASLHRNGALSADTSGQLQDQTQFAGGAARAAIKEVGSVAKVHPAE